MKDKNCVCAVRVPGGTYHGELLPCPLHEAAQDLLEALEKEVVESWNSYCLTPDYCSKEIQQKRCNRCKALAAIARARGKVVKAENYWPCPQCGLYYESHTEGCSKA